MDKIKQFNRLIRKTKKPKTKERLLNLINLNNTYADDALDYIERLDKLVEIYYNFDNIAIYGVIEGLFYYKEFKEEDISDNV